MGQRLVAAGGGSPMSATGGGGATSATGRGVATSATSGAVLRQRLTRVAPRRQLAGAAPHQGKVNPRSIANGTEGQPSGRLFSPTPLKVSQVAGCWAVLLLLLRTLFSLIAPS